ncbi:MAG: flagellar export protein FliJ [Bacteriovoracia bacterium]
MRRFQFRLEPVLKERKRIEDLKLREFALAQRFLEKIKGELEKLNSDLKDGIDKASLLASASTNSVANLQTADTFISGQKRRIQWKKEDIERTEKFVAKKRNEHLAARQKREAMEKLKARKLEFFKKEERKKEQKNLDDLYVMRARFKEVSEGDEA